MTLPTKLFNRNYVLQWQGQTVSRLGSQGFSVAMVLWIKQATGSASLMGLMMMVSSLIGVILGPIGGTLADRYSRRNIIIFSGLVQGAAILLLSGLLFIIPGATQIILVWLFVASTIIAIVNAFFLPAIQSTIPDLVPVDKVTSANSLGQFSYQITVFVGQGLGGTLFRILGAPVLFLIGGITSVYAAISEILVEIPQHIPEKKTNWKAQFVEFRQDIVEGLQYIWHRPGLKETTLISSVLSFFSAPIIILLPFYVEDVLKVQIDWYGFLMVSYSVGTLAGFFLIGAVMLSTKVRAYLMISCLILESFGYGVLGLVTNPNLALVLAFLGGFTSGVVSVNIMTILQITTPGQIRGRVFGLLGTLAGGLAPIAMGLAGVAADLLDQNIKLIYVSCGISMFSSSVFFSLNRKFREFIATEPATSSRPGEGEPNLPNKNGTPQNASGALDDSGNPVG
jgi:MFS family permease